MENPYQNGMWKQQFQMEEMHRKNRFVGKMSKLWLSLCFFHIYVFSCVALMKKLMITIVYPIKHTKIDRIIFVETDESWSTHDEYLLKMISFIDISWFSYKCGIVGLVVVQSDEHQCEFFRWLLKTKRLQINDIRQYSLVECDWEDSLKCCLLVHMPGNLCICCLQFRSSLHLSSFSIQNAQHKTYAILSYKSKKNNKKSV